MATDGQRNIYGLSTIGMFNGDIDDVEVGYYGGLGYDISLFGFSCDGGYRWSKVIGGGGKETVNSVETDTEGNVYIAGRFGNCQSVEHGGYPPRIDDDIILPQTYDHCSLLFIAKYSPEGELLWLKQPTPYGDSSQTGASYGFTSDGNGNLYWLVFIPPGTYADGAFENTMEGSNYFIFQYDSDGNFVGATHLDMTVNSFSASFLQFYRNPYNGHYYFVTTKVEGDTVIINGESIDKCFVMFSFDSQGNHLWTRTGTREASNSISTRIYGLEFDQSNNIYLGGKITGLGMEELFGFIIEEPLIPVFVMKLDSTAENLLWASNGNKGAPNDGGFVLKGNELALTAYGYGEDFTWGDQVHYINETGELHEVIFVKFDAETGECTGINHIQGHAGTGESGTSLVADANGDYILGGWMELQLTDSFGNTVTSNGGDSDFFIAKYAAETCPDMGTIEIMSPEIVVYPNPVSGIATVTPGSKMAYHLYNPAGRQISSGELSPEKNTLDFSTYPPGVYILRLTGMEKQEKKTVRIIKKSTFSLYEKIFFYP